MLVDLDQRLIELFSSAVHDVVAAGHEHVRAGEQLVGGSRPNDPDHPKDG